LPFSPREGSFITFVPPPDNGTMGKETIAAILVGNDYPETGGYRRQIIDFIDFTAYGQLFTQTVVTVTPDRPLIRNGKKIVVSGRRARQRICDGFRAHRRKQGRCRGLARQARHHLRGADAQRDPGFAMSFSRSGNGDHRNSHT
jgi:hypothetical protein